MEPTSSKVIAIAAVGKRTRAIGRASGEPLLWHIPADLRRFKERTTGHPVIMGRTTYLSLPENFRPLRDRTNIVVTRTSKASERFSWPGVHIEESVEKAIEYARRAPGGDKVYIIGGGQIYAYSIEHDLVDELEVTEVDDDTPGDVFFPDYSHFVRTIEPDEEHLDGAPPFVFRMLGR